MVQYERLAGENGWGNSRGTSWMEVIGRLRDGATIEQADAAAKQVYRRLESEYPETNEGCGARVDAFGPIPAEGRVAIRAVVAVMTALVGLILAIICANVAGMMLARSATREREITAFLMETGLFVMDGKQRMVKNELEGCEKTFTTKGL